MHDNLGSVYSVVFTALCAESPKRGEMYSGDLNSELLIVHYSNGSDAGYHGLKRPSLLIRSPLYISLLAASFR